MKLDLNCTVDYYKDFLSKEESQEIYNDIFHNYKIATYTKKHFGDKEFISPNGKIMFLDKELKDGNKFPYKQWGQSFVWSPLLLNLKKRIEQIAKRQFHVCVCIYYPDGTTGVGYHSDYIAFGDTSVIPSISLGMEREFLLREKATQKEHKMILETGSMLIMGENCQERYEHSLPINPIYKNGRINLTFRKYGL
ncbi:MAG: alpha-ketoglutarate-dependent dioxygenase AlkB [Bacteroidota bacterium]